MGYSRSRQTVARMSVYLDKLKAGARVEFPTSDPRKLAYQIRDAMHAAEVNAVEPYNQMRRVWLVKEDYARGCVTCESRIQKVDKIILATPDVPVILEALMSRAHESEMFAVNKSLSDEELLPIWNWMQSVDRGWYIIRVPEDHRTMFLYRAGREYVDEWKPSDV